MLRRPKFPFTDDQIVPLLDQFVKEGVAVSAKPLLKKLPDPDDDMFLEVAIAAQAEAIVTGNKQHFPEAVCGPIRVLSPDEFVDWYQSRQ